VYLQDTIFIEKEEFIRGLINSKRKFQDEQLEEIICLKLIIYIVIMDKCRYA
jgi:hypothetical protein